MQQHISGNQTILCSVTCAVLCAAISESDAEILDSGSSALLTKAGLLIWMVLQGVTTAPKPLPTAKTAHKPEAIIEVH